ncbi:MAG TPA: DUF2442 domain-containing protein [Terriglobales bacterium]|nr:DUF2442 domain-containing protein [Terriglobales bacterium]
MPKSKAAVNTTNQEIDSALARARKFAASDRRVIRVAYEKKSDLLTLHLDDGVRVSIPRMSLQGLRDAKPAQLSKVEILGRGTGLHWPLLDVDHYVPGLLNHVFGTSRWMAELGRRGGAATSTAKASAARANGKKGGRPRERVA